MNVIDIEPPAPAPAYRGCLFALLFMGLVAGAVQVAFVAGCASQEGGGLPPGALEFVTNYLDRIVSGQGGASSHSSGVQPGGDAGDAAGPASISAAFYWDGSRWVGGKFDGISTSRTTRDFKNIKDGYGGWDWAAFSGARRRAFCIVSKDGRKRTNLIEEAR